MIYQIAFLNSAGRASLHVTNSFNCARDASRYARDVMARSHAPILVEAEVGREERPELLFLLRNAALDKTLSA